LALVIVSQTHRGERPNITGAAKPVSRRTPVSDAMAPRGLQIVQRVALAVVGGYVLSAEAAAWAALGLRPWLGAAEAVVLTAMLAFVLYLVLLLWAFAERRLLRLWLVLAVLPVASHILGIGLGPGAGGGG